MALPYREHPVPPSLSRWVECTWSVEVREPLVKYPVPPDGCIDILFSPNYGLRAVGTMTTEQRFDFPRGARTVGARFRPGMAGSFLRAAPGELTDSMISLEHVWGAAGRELDQKLRESGNPEGLLAASLPLPAAEPNPVQRAIEAIVVAHGDLDLDRVAGQANLSPRQFRRRCLEESGLTPKHLCRILRFRRACRLAQGVLRPEWSGIAADVGYFDQAHLIHDFREFTGRTPMAVFSNTEPGPDR